MEENRANSGKVEFGRHSNISANLNQQDKCMKYGENKEEVDAESNSMELCMVNQSVRLSLEEEMRQLREENSSLREGLQKIRTVEGQMNKVEETRINSGKAELRKHTNIKANLNNQQYRCVKYGESKEEVDAESNTMEPYIRKEPARLPLKVEMCQLREENSSLGKGLEKLGTVEGKMNTMEETRTTNGKAELGTHNIISANHRCVKYGESKEEVDAESNPMEPHIRNEPVRLPLKEEMRQPREENSNLRKDRKKYRNFEKQMQTIKETRISSGKAVLGKHTNISANFDQQCSCVKYGESKEEVDAESNPMQPHMSNEPVRIPLEEEMRQLQQENFSLRADVEKSKNLEGQMKIMEETLSLLRQEVDAMKKSSAFSRTRTLFAVFFCITLFFARLSLSVGCP